MNEKTNNEGVLAYSPMVLAGDYIYFSGVLSEDSKSGELIYGSIEEETANVLNKLTSLLKDVGRDLSCIVSSEIFLSDMDDFEGFNKVYLQYFSGCPVMPARRTVGVQLYGRCKLEASFIAYTGKNLNCN